MTENIPQDINGDIARFPSENPSPVLRLSPEGKILYRNPATIKLVEALGLGEDEIFKILPKDLIGLIAYALKTAQPVFGLEVEVLNKGYSYALVPVVESNYVNLYGTDITERKKAEEALKISELRYRRLFETAKDGILILEAETGIIVDVNPFLSQMLGFSRENLLGRKVWELGFLKDIIANKDKFTQLQDKEYVRYEDLPLETADGRIVEVEFISNVYKIDHYNVIQCNIRDISDRKKIENELKRLIEEWGKTFNSISDLVFIQDIESRIIRVNAAFAQALKMDPKEIVGRKCYELFHKTGHPWPSCPYEAAKKDGNAHIEEVGDFVFGVPLLITVSPIFDNKGNVVGSVHVAKDISAIKATEKELKKRLYDLEIFNKAAIDRELRIIELKKEVVTLKAQLNK